MELSKFSGILTQDLLLASKKPEPRYGASFQGTITDGYISYPKFTMPYAPIFDGSSRPSGNRLGFQLGPDFKLGPVQVMPFFNFAWDHLWVGAFGERLPGGDFKSEKRNLDFLVIGGGVQITYPIERFRVGAQLYAGTAMLILDISSDINIGGSIIGEMFLPGDLLVGLRIYLEGQIYDTRLRGSSADNDDWNGFIGGVGLIVGWNSKDMCQCE